MLEIYIFLYIKKCWNFLANKETYVGLPQPTKETCTRIKKPTKDIYSGLPQHTTETYTHIKKPTNEIYSVLPQPTKQGSPTERDNVV